MRRAEPWYLSRGRRGIMPGKALPATFGMSEGRRTSLCSELRYILRRLGRHEPDRRGVELVTPAARACLDALPGKRQYAVIDFLRFLESERITPDAADADTLRVYRTHCATRTLCRDPAARARQVATTWNWAHQHVPNWPGQPLILAGRADRYTFPLESYPESFQRDLERYAEQLAGRDIAHIFSEAVFERDPQRPRRGRRALRPASIHMGRFMIRCAAAALVLMGVEQGQLTSLRDLVDPLDRAETIIRFFLKRRGDQKNPMAERVARTLHLLARDYCGLPEEQAATITAWAKQVELQKTYCMTDKNRRRVRALMQPRARAMLLWYPAELMKRASSPDLRPEDAARLAMYATAMEILLICPMRRSNLAGLRLDQHLHCPDPRERTKITHIFLGADEVKNDLPIEWPVPPESGKLIEKFLKRHRHHLADPDNPYLFGSGDKQRGGQHLGEHLSGMVTRDIGVEFNVHLGRHFAAWNFLRQNPGQYEVVRQVLGHRDINVTVAYYVGLEADSAARHFDATVLRDRQASRQLANQAFRAGTGALSRPLRRPRK